MSYLDGRVAHDASRLMTSGGGSTYLCMLVGWKRPDPDPAAQRNPEYSQKASGKPSMEDGKTASDYVFTGHELIVFDSDS